MKSNLVQANPSVLVMIEDELFNTGSILVEDYCPFYSCRQNLRNAIYKLQKMGWDIQRYKNGKPFYYRNKGADEYRLMNKPTTRYTPQKTGRPAGRVNKFNKGVGQ